MSEAENFVAYFNFNNDLWYNAIDLREFLNFDKRIKCKAGCIYYKTPIILAQILAVVINATLVDKNDLPQNQLHQHPTFLTELTTYDTPENTIFYHWMNHGNSFKNQPVFMQVDPIKFNFVYCQKPKRMAVSPTDFRVFTDPFDSWTWLAFLLTLLLVGKIDNSSDLFIKISACLSPGLSTSSLKPPKLLFIGWMYFCLILSNMYSGKMASVMIHPSPEYRINSIDEIHGHNFSLVSSTFHQKMIINKLTALLKSYATTNKYVSKSVVNLYMLMNKGVKSVNDVREFYEIMTSSLSNYAVTLDWATALLVAREAEVYAHLFRKKKKRCFVGKKLIKVGSGFYGVLPPNAFKISRVFGNIVESGIYRYWMDDYYAGLYEIRPGTRGRFQGPSKNLKRENDWEQEIGTLKMEGKTVTVFVLWGFCLLASIACVAIECIL